MLPLRLALCRVTRGATHQQKGRGLWFQGLATNQPPISQTWQMSAIFGTDLLFLSRQQCVNGNLSEWIFWLDIDNVFASRLNFLTLFRIALEALNGLRRVKECRFCWDSVWKKKLWGVALLRFCSVNQVRRLLATFATRIFIRSSHFKRDLAPKSFAKTVDFYIM